MRPEAMPFTVICGIVLFIWTMAMIFAGKPSPYDPGEIFWRKIYSRLYPLGVLGYVCGLGYFWSGP